jgi:hypothetical protein
VHAKKLLLTLALVLVPGASAAVASLAACSSSTTDNGGSPSPGLEAGAYDDVVTAASDAPADAPKDVTTDVAKEASSDGGAACNAVTQAATEAMTSTIKSAAPTATGGMILPGTYYLTELNVYDPAGPASGPMPSGLTVTLVIAGNVMDSVQDLPDGTQTFSETFSVNGTTLKRDLTCPKPGPDLAAKYTVTGTGITIYETDPMSMTVAGSVYVKH